MCGIWGASAPTNGSISFSAAKFLRQAAVAGTVRGYDGTGIVAVCESTTVWDKGIKTETKPNVWYHKTGGTGAELLRELKSMGGWIDNLPGRVTTVYGHNRAATVGKVSQKTAHPFAAARAIGIHNGTLSNGWETRLQAAKRIEVDSEALIRCISHRGYRHALSKAVGAMAVVWTDTNTRETFIFRNHERPVYYFTSNTGVLFWGSEKGMLEWLADRNHITIDKDGICSLPTSTVFKIDKGELIEVEKVYNTATPYQSYTSGQGYNSYNSGHPVGTAPYKNVHRHDSSLNNSPKQGDTTEKKSCPSADDTPDTAEVCDKSENVSLQELFDGDILITDEGHIVTPHVVGDTLKGHMCSSCLGTLLLENEDHILVRAFHDYYFCDNDTCLHDHFIDGDTLTSVEFIDCYHPIEFVMATSDWDSDPVTNIDDYLKGQIDYVYLSDSVQARIEVQPRVKKTGTKAA